MKLDHPSDVCFKQSAISFGAPDMPPPDVGSSIGPISLHNAIDLRRPTFVDLSGISFLDLQSARELAVRAQLYAHHLFLRNPSPQVTASLQAFGLWVWVHPGREEPPVLSEPSS